MTDRDFDKRFKEKLNTLDPQIPDGAWNKFKVLMPLPWYKNLFNSNVGWIFGAASTALLLFNYFNSENPTTQTTVLSNESKIDTVYRPLLERDTIIKHVYLTQFVEIPRPITQVNDSRIIESTQENTPLEIKEPETYLAVENPIETEPLTYREPKKMPKDTTQIALAEVSKKEPKKNLLSKIDLIPGVEMNYMGGNSFGYGIIGEILLKNRFSLTTGISINNSSPENFKQPQEFNRTTGKIFNQNLGYQAQGTVMESSGEIKDISIKTSRVRVPIYLSYYVPITYKLDFLFHTGTRLDLKVSESVSYVNDNYGDMAFRTFENQHKPAIFNNLFYGMGVQYRYGKLSGMLTPYFEFPFAKPNYVIKDNKFGINAALKFSLK